jgi:hypothetical protein
MPFSSAKCYVIPLEPCPSDQDLGCQVGAGRRFGSRLLGTTYPMDRTSRAATANRWGLKLFSCCFGNDWMRASGREDLSAYYFGVATRGAPLGVIRTRRSTSRPVAGGARKGLPGFASARPSSLTSQLSGNRGQSALCRRCGPSSVLLKSTPSRSWIRVEHT